MAPQGPSAGPQTPPVARKGNPLPHNDETADAIRSHIQFLVDDLCQPRPRTDSPFLRSVCRMILRTYSDLHYNILTGPTPWEDTWMGRHPQAWRSGATMASDPASFMRNRYTWVSMRHEPEDQLYDLESAAIAIETSIRPARVVLLLRDSGCNRQYVSKPSKGVHKRVIANISRHAKGLFIKDDTERLTHPVDMAPLSPDTPLILVSVHNSQAPSYHTSHLKGLL